MRGRVRGGSSYFSGEVTLGEKREGRGGTQDRKVPDQRAQREGNRKTKTEQKRKEKGKK